MLTTIWTAAAVLSACTAGRRHLCRAGRRETAHWGGRVRLTALWNEGAAFGLPVGRGALAALSAGALAAVLRCRRRPPPQRVWSWEAASATCGSGCGMAGCTTTSGFPGCRVPWGGMSTTWLTWPSSWGRRGCCWAAGAVGRQGLLRPADGMQGAYRALDFFGVTRMT